MGGEFFGELNHLFSGPNKKIKQFMSLEEMLLLISLNKLNINFRLYILFMILYSLGEVFYPPFI